MLVGAVCVWLLVRPRADTCAEPPASAAGGPCRGRLLGSPAVPAGPPGPGPIIPRRSRKPHTAGAVSARGAGRDGAGRGKSPWAVCGVPRPARSARGRSARSRPASGGAARTPAGRGGRGGRRAAQPGTRRDGERLVRPGFSSSSERFEGPLCFVSRAINL